MLVLAFIFPFLFIVSSFKLQALGDLKDLFWAFKNTTIQAFFSALIALVFGTWLALGLVWVRQRASARWFDVVRLICLLPNLLPVLFIILAVFAVVEPFPMGLIGIVLIHSFLNVGLVGLAIFHLIQNKFSNYLEYCLVQGVSKFQFLKKIFFPLATRDLFLIFLFVFTLCFASFSVPLMAGGGRGTTLEVLIYEKIRLSSDWSGATVIALVQSACVFILSISSLKARPVLLQKQGNLSLISAFHGLLPLLLITGVLLYGYFSIVIEGLQHWSFFTEFKVDILNSVFGSWYLMFIVAVVAYALLMVVAYAFPAPLLKIFMNGYMTPGTALVGFSFLVLFPQGSFFSWIKISLAFLLLNLASIYRLGWGQSLDSLNRQVEVAEVFGASEWIIFRKIKWPQLHSKAVDLVSLLAIWVGGDFAVSRILAEKDLSLAMLVESLMTGYRLSQAGLLSLLLIFVILIGVVVIKGVGHVIHRKFIL